MRVCMQVKDKEPTVLPRRWIRLHYSHQFECDGGKEALRTQAVRPPPQQEPSPQDPTRALGTNRSSSCTWNRWSCIIPTVMDDLAANCCNVH